MSDITSLKNQNVPQELKQYLVKAASLIAESKSLNTRKSYLSDWTAFDNWCKDNHTDSMPASVETVIAYLSYLFENDYKVSTIKRKLSTISFIHQAKQYDSPTLNKAVHDVLTGIKRIKKVTVNKKKPVSTGLLQEVFAKQKLDLRGFRDRALLLIGFAGAFRRSELVSLDVEDIQFTREGLRITLPYSKTDQEGKGYEKGITYGSNPETCPVRTLQDWLSRAEITSGPIFRPINRHDQISTKRLTGHAVAGIVKKYIKGINFPSENYSGHSLRAGFVTEAASNDASIDAIMRQTGHRSVEMVREYIRKENLFKQNASAKLGL